MFIRKKKNKSGSISVHVIQKDNGYKIIRKIGTFPDMKGLSASNLKYMRFFAQECPKITIGQQPADQLSWFHGTGSGIGGFFYRDMTVSRRCFTIYER